MNSILRRFLSFSLLAALVSCSQQEPSDYHEPQVTVREMQPSSPQTISAAEPEPETDSTPSQAYVTTTTAVQSDSTEIATEPDPAESQTTSQTTTQNPPKPKPKPKATLKTTKAKQRLRELTRDPEYQRSNGAIKRNKVAQQLNKEGYRKENGKLFSQFDIPKK